MENFTDKCCLRAAFHRNRETGTRTVETFLYDSLWDNSMGVKRRTALEAGEEPGIGYAKTFGNSEAFQAL